MSVPGASDKKNLSTHPLQGANDGLVHRHDKNFNLSQYTAGKFGTLGAQNSALYVLPCLTQALAAGSCVMQKGAAAITITLPARLSTLAHKAAP